MKITFWEYEVVRKLRTETLTDRVTVSGLFLLLLFFSVGCSRLYFKRIATKEKRIRESSGRGHSDRRPELSIIYMIPLLVILLGEIWGKGRPNAFGSQSMNFGHLQSDCRLPRMRTHIVLDEIWDQISCYDGDCTLSSVGTVSRNYTSDN